MIDQLAVGGGWPDVLRDAIKSAGVTYVSLAGEETVTAEQCKTAIEADDALTKRIDWTRRFNAAMNQIGTSEQAAGVASLRKIADETEA